MGDIILLVAVLAVFILILFAVDRFDRFMKENYRGPKALSKGKPNRYVINMRGKDKQELSREIGVILDESADAYDAFEIYMFRYEDVDRM